LDFNTLKNMKKLILFLSIIGCLTVKGASPITITPSSPATLSPSSSVDTLTVTGTGAWTATSNVGWCVIISGSSGSGNGKIVYTVAANATVSNGERVATITVTPSGNTALLVYVGQNTSYVARKLHGTYAKLVSDTSFHIRTEDAILSAKSYPTNFYWIEVDSMVNMNIRQLDQQGLVTFTIKFKLYWDYLSFWQWFNPFRLPIQPVFTTGWIDICAGDGFDLCSDLDTQIKNSLAAYFNISPTKVVIYSY
jgi:hypothetical protein